MRTTDSIPRLPTLVTGEYSGSFGKEDVRKEELEKRGGLSHTGRERQPLWGIP